MPSGHNDLWASENKTIRNLEFLYETSFENMSLKLYSVDNLYVKFVLIAIVYMNHNIIK